MPDLLATTTRGLEEVALREVEELTGRPGWVEHPGLIGLPGDTDDVYRLNLFARSLYRVCLVLARGSIPDLDAFYEQVRAVPFGSLLRGDQSLAVRAERQGEHPFTSQDIARVAGQAILDSYRVERGERPPVNLEEPEVVFRVEVRGDRFWLGLDTTGDVSLACRPYQVYIHPAGLKPPIAYALVRLSGWEVGERLLDPMCGAGTLLLEAGCWARRLPLARPFPFQGLPWYDPRRMEAVRREHPPREADLHLLGYDVSPRHLEGARRNAEAASIPLSLSLADAGQAPLEAERIVVNPPYGVRMGSPHKVARVYSAFAENLHRSPWRSLVVITARPGLFLHAFGQRPQRTLEVFHGGLYTQVLVFRR